VEFKGAGLSGGELAPISGTTYLKLTPAEGLKERVLKPEDFDAALGGVRPVAAAAAKLSK